MPSRVVKRAKQFIAPHLFPAPLYQLRQQNAHCVIISNRKLMRMLAMIAPPYGKLYSHWRGFEPRNPTAYRSVADAGTAERIREAEVTTRTSLNVTGLPTGELSAIL